MVLEGPEGLCFRLTAQGWLRPRGARDEIEANRLRVRLALEADEGSWAETVPCLLSWELERLAEWFRTLAGHRRAEEEQRFLDPDLRFRIAPASGLARVLHVGIDLRGRKPAGAPAPFGEVAFALEDADLAAVARSLAADVRRFPTREP